MEVFFQVIVFYIFAAMAVVGASLAAFSRRLVYSVFSLLLTFVGVAGMYVFLSADFLAAVQVLLYAGGIMVLMVFGVMLTHRVADVSVETNFTHMRSGLAISAALYVALLVFIYRTPWAELDALPPHAPTTRLIGRHFMGDYIVPFEYSSVLLLLIVIGAATLVRKEVD